MVERIKWANLAKLSAQALERNPTPIHTSYCSNTSRITPNRARPARIPSSPLPAPQGADAVADECAGQQGQCQGNVRPQISMASKEEAPTVLLQVVGVEMALLHNITQRSRIPWWGRAHWRVLWGFVARPKSDITIPTFPWPSLAARGAEKCSPPVCLEGT